MEHQTVEPTYGPLVASCAKFGLSKNRAFQLVSDGLLETFMIGRRRFVMLDSLRSLPERLAASGQAK